MTTSFWKHKFVILSTKLNSDVPICKWENLSIIAVRRPPMNEFMNLFTKTHKANAVNMSMLI